MTMMGEQQRHHHNIPDTRGDAPKMPHRWMTAEETAGLLRVHTTTVHELCKRGALPAMKVGKEWRISARGLAEQAELGDAHTRLIHETAECVAETVVSRILGALANALTQSLAVQPTTHGHEVCMQRFAPGTCAEVE